ncbi:pirin family protein [Pedobacter immunditicola]|uniref:pirin family protein n=1 Tax=Pedobacter immunditicola TaxID=3133440 RepID=UPI0030B3E2AC
MAQSILHKAETRGHANHGWLNSYHTFSFANYFNPERVQFGALRVLNDDQVSGGMGFGTHPHQNMEIVSIALEGELQHEDSMGNVAVIKPGEIQVLSAGTGITHKEFNKNADQQVKFLQIWVLPNQQNVKPRYDQLKVEDETKINQLIQILSPDREDAGVWIHQDAWFHLGKFDQDTALNYQVKQQGNGVYFFVLKGSVVVNDQVLDTRDGFGIWDTDSIAIKATAGAEVLLMEVPMD